jgi:ubiquinone/menaquinone biosynthesis C-methylase UbiE
MADPFEGVTGMIAAQVMARMNRAAEAEAVEMLDPAPDATVLAVGFGPGVGVALLAERLTAGRILGVDPSATMLKTATRANRAAIAAGKVELRQARADATSAPDAAFDGAVAVNALQLCEPFAAAAGELARVLKPGARLVSLTHDWALARHGGSAEAWLAKARAALEAAGFVEVRDCQGRAEKGRIVALTARRG